MQDPKSSTQAQTNRESCLSLVTAKDLYFLAPIKTELLDLQIHHPLSDGLIAQFRGQKINIQSSIFFQALLGSFLSFLSPPFPA